MNIGRAIPTIKKMASAELPTRWGPFRISGFERTVYSALGNRKERAVALTTGNLYGRPPLVRIHVQCLTGDAFGSLRCDCGEQFKIAMRMIQREGAGIVIYQELEGGEVGLMSKLRAYALQDHALYTHEEDEHHEVAMNSEDYGISAEILHYFGIERVRLLSNNPLKRKALADRHIMVIRRVPCESVPNPYTIDYLLTKKEKLSHELSLT